MGFGERNKRGRWNNKKKFDKKPRDNHHRTVGSFSHKKPRQLNTLVEKLSEQEAGITEYLYNDTPGISGIIKSRFCDFHVNEINLAGQTAKLTDLSIPECFQENAASQSGDKLDFSARPECFPEESLLDIQKLVAVNSEAESNNSDVPVEIDVTNLSKDDRTKIHVYVKKIFGKKIVSSTKEKGECKIIEVKRHVKGATRDVRLQWPNNIGEYVYFVVYKEALDTHQVALKMADRLRVNPSCITYAGVKDRRAKTSQWFCLRKMHPKKIINACKCFGNIYVGNLEFHNESLKLGKLFGNSFRLAIRNVQVDDSLINEALTRIKEGGFINYYGLQRFGNDKEVPTFEIGVKLLQGKWKEACDLILQPKSGDDQDSETTKAKRVYQETSDATHASKEFHKLENKCLESRLLSGLAKHHENDYVTALENIPRNNRLLYLHSFQSLIWNKIVSRRIKEFGLDPRPGDLVMNTTEESQLEEDETEETKDSSDNIPRPQVKILTPEDVPNYTKYDIVLPLPGYDIIYPENETKSWYRELLSEYSLTLEMPKQKVKTYNLSGTYRHILDRVSDMTWQIVRYDHPNDVLIRSDYEHLKSITELETKSDGRYKGVVLEFSLRSSRYATMVLREILKCDTSSSAQAKMSHETIEEKDDDKKVEQEKPLEESKMLECEVVTTEQESGVTEENKVLDSSKDAVLVVDDSTNKKRQLEDCDETSTDCAPEKKQKCADEDDKMSENIV